MALDEKEWKRLLAQLPALHKAVRAGDGGKVQALLAAGSDPDRRDDLGRTPLAWAVEAGETEICRMLLDGVPCRDSSSSATRKRSKDAKSSEENPGAKKRLDGKNSEEPGAPAAPEPPLADESPGRTVPSVSSKADPNLRVPMMLDVDVRQSSLTPFILATQLDRPAVCKLLQSKGADPLSVTSSHDRLCDRLTALHWTVRWGDECIMTLIDAGLDVNDAGNPTQTTPLHWACAAGQVKAVTRLMDMGASTEALNDGEETPAMVAQRCGRDDIVDLLVSRGAKRPQPPQAAKPPQSAGSSGCCMPAVLLSAAVLAGEATLHYLR